MLVSLVKGAPALLIKKERTLVVGDLHIGLDLKYGREGISFHGATERMSGKLLELCEETGARSVVIIGDVKESISYPGFGEFMELKRFFAALKGLKVSIAKGNHDGEMEKVLKNLDLDIELRKEIFVDGVALMHGNAWPSEEAMRKRYLVVGHRHFAVDSDGRIEKAWLFAGAGRQIGERYNRYNKGIRLIVTPPFNDMILGSAMDNDTGDSMPLFRQKVFDWKRTKVYDLDKRLVRRAF
jgi:uncharacterized protein